MKKSPIFVVLGSLGVGKTTLMKTLISRNTDKYIILNGELCNIMTFPEFLPQCRQSWVDLCFDISDQTGRSVVFYGDMYPDVFNGINEDKRSLMNFISLVCDNETLKNRLEKKLKDKIHNKIPNIDMTYLDMSLLRNQVYWGNTKYKYPQMKCLDTTYLTVEESADQIHKWITYNL